MSWLKKIKFRYLLALLAAGLAVFVILPVRKSALYPPTLASLQILDRRGVMLRQVLSRDEAISHWVPLGKISPYLLKATLAAEDKRFYRHCGIDFLALGRAFRQNIAAGALVSGGSTITQQLAKNLYHLTSRNLANKAGEALLALRLELWLSKREILELYFNRISYGNLTTGIAAAAEQYFGKPCLYLSVGESAFLAAIPRAPSYYDPYINFTAVNARKAEIIRQMAKEKLIPAREAQAALQEQLKLKPARQAFRAPHWCNHILAVLQGAKDDNCSKVKTTLDFYLQQEVERMLRRHINRLKDSQVTNAAAVVMKNDTGEILAWAGSCDFWDTNRQGQVDGVLALRQPGSAIKPFTYALALENGMTASELIPDLETHFPTAQGSFSPLNYDETYHGPVRLRNALACSYNVCAVAVLYRLGVDKLLRTLKALGLDHLTRPASHYGLALTLGCAETSLLEMVRAYKSLANNGYYSPEAVILQAWDQEGKDRPLTFPKPGLPGHQVFSPQAAYLITDMLQDPQARAPAFGLDNPLRFAFPCAAKTGTTKSFRDNWTVGYTPEYTVGVWVGNFDNTPMHRVSGITGAGPLFKDIMLYLNRHKKFYRDFACPGGLEVRRICPDSGELVGQDCPNTMSELYLKGQAPMEACSVHRKIALDIRTGLEANSGCPREFVRERLYCIYPALYHNWMEQQGFPRPPAFASLPDRRQKSRPERLAVTFPLNESVFRLDPVLRREYQTLAAQAEVPAGVESLDWWVDNRRCAQVSYPFNFRWELQPGTHCFKVSAEQGGRKVESQGVQIRVY